MTAILGLAGGLFFSGFYLFTACFPQLETCSGYYEQEYREGGKSITTHRYIFNPQNGGLKQGFYLDTSSKRKIYPDDFEVDKYYKITYEETTRIILNVEEVSPP